MEYYGCKKCHTFIARSDQFFGEIQDSVVRTAHTAENVTIKPTGRPTAGVFCNNPRCKKKLGYKLIKPVDEIKGTDAHLVGTFFFTSDRLARIDPPVQPQPVQPGGVASATSSNVNREDKAEDPKN